MTERSSGADELAQEKARLEAEIAKTIARKRARLVQIQKGSRLA